MNDLIFKIIEVVIYVLIAATFRYLIPVVITKLKHSRYEFIGDLISDAVYAMEQKIQGPSMGADRKHSVIDYATKLCKKYGINMTDEQIDMLIEAAVKAMKEETK